MANEEKGISTIEKEVDSEVPVTPNTDSVEACNCESESEEQCADTSENEESDHNQVPLPINDGKSCRRKRLLKSKWNPDGRKYKLRTSKDIYDRLKWDTEVSINSNGNGEDTFVNVAGVYIGYKDRFLGMCEVSFEEFQPGGDIPFHRLYYFRTGGPPVEPFIGKEGEVKVRDDNLPEGTVFIWDRDTRIDLIFNSGNSTVIH